MSSWLPTSLRGSLVAVVFGILLGASAASAATFPNLYRVTVTPDPAAADQRGAAIEAAMTRLLIRVTGNRNAALDPDLAPLVTSGARFLESYGLDRQGRPQVGFLRGQVEQALTSLGKPVWGPERPLTLLWIAVDDGLGGRAMLGADESGETGFEPGIAPSPEMLELLKTLRTEFAAVADERGLPIVLPLLDIEDMTAVTFADVWGGFDDQIALASQRYRADAVLIGRVRPGLFGPEVQWLFLRGVDRQVLVGAAIRDGLDAAADIYATELSTIGGATTTLIRVLDVATSSDYGRVMSYLERQSALQAVDVDSYENGVLNLRVAARGDARVLERLFALGGVLRPAATLGSGALAFEIVRNGPTP